VYEDAENPFRKPVLLQTLCRGLGRSRVKPAESLSSGSTLKY
jgi:hypothetical protein